MWWTHYAALVIGFVFGFFVCAIFTVARRADDEMELALRGKEDPPDETHWT